MVKILKITRKMLKKGDKNMRMVKITQDNCKNCQQKL